MSDELDEFIDNFYKYEEEEELKKKLDEDRKI